MSTQTRTHVTRARALPSGGLTIAITSGIGAAHTALAAFDGALREAGIANFNLIPLSSVVPPGSTVIVTDGIAEAPEGAWGDRLYVVLAECRVQVPNEEAWAGLGWVQDDATGKGLFVEHTGHSRPQVESDIEASLGSMTDGRREVSFGEPQFVVRGTVCHAEPVCALVTAVFESDAWAGAQVIELP